MRLVPHPLSVLSSANHPSSFNSPSPLPLLLSSRALVPFSMHHAPCYTHHAPCTTHHAPCTMHHAPCTMASSLPPSCGLCRVACQCRKVVRTFRAPPDAVEGTMVAADANATLHVRVHQQGGHRTPTSVPPPLHISPHQRTLPFSPAQLFRARQSVRYASPPTPTMSGNAAPRPSGMGPRPGVARVTRDDSSPQQATPSAAIGTAAGAALPAHTSNATSAPGVATKITELRGVLELRKSQALTPYRVEAWQSFLHRCNLLVKYPNLISSLHFGFDAGIRPILSTYAPSNSPTLHLHPEAYRDMVSNEFKKGRYIGPCTRQEIEALIGPFQSSPLSWVPKPGKPGKYRAVHNFSFPHTPTPEFASINSSIDADMYPCTWALVATTLFQMSLGHPREWMFT